MGENVTTCTVYSHTREEMRERLLRQGWHTWYSENYWVHPRLVSNPKIQDYTNYGMSLEDAFMWGDEKIKPSILGRLMDSLKRITSREVTTNKEG